MNEQGVMPDEQFEAMTPEQAMQNIDNYIAQNYGNQIPDQQQQQQEQFQQEQQNFNGEDSQQQQYAEQPQQQEVNPEVYKEAYDYIMQPFKAAGKEFQLRDFHEARGLMQQGIDYTKKQQALKPRLMEMRTLENNGMLGDNLNYAIDLFQGKPEAIAKLIKDKNIDINSLQPQAKTDEWGNPIAGSEKTNEYVPVNHRISEKQFELENVLDDIKQSPKYTDISKYLNEIDDASGRKFFENPSDLKGLQQLAETGYHDKIIKEVEYLRAVNNPHIAGLNDYEAYEKVGQAILAREYQAIQQGMNQNAPVQQQQPYPYNNQQPQLTPAQQQQMYQQYQQQMQMQQRKQSVSPIRNKPQTPVVRQYDPLFSNYSDEEFEKLNINDLMRN